MNRDEMEMFEMRMDLAPIVAKWFGAYFACNGEIRKVAEEMVNIADGNYVDGCERAAALSTLVEALFPAKGTTACQK